jgi:alkylation response protein AidB-like acyl-CoA dehydrogenase
VRTGEGERLQEGISFLLIDMKSPGVSVRPIATIDAVHHVNEVFFDNVRVPTENLVGEEGKGWTYAKFLLRQERLIAAETGKARLLLRQLEETAATVIEAGRSLAEHDFFARRLAEVEIDLRALEAVCWRLLGLAEAGAPPGVEANMLKIRGSDLLQRITELMVEALGRRGLPFDTRALDAASNAPDIGPPGAAGMVYEFLHGRATTIWGGTNEIQRGIIAKERLEL